MKNIVVWEDYRISNSNAGIYGFILPLFVVQITNTEMKRKFFERTRDYFEKNDPFG